MENIDNKKDLEKFGEKLKDKIKTCALCYYDYYINGNIDSYHGYKNIYSSLDEEGKLLVNEQISNIHDMNIDNPNDDYRSIRRH